jgi:hypothetical protein
MGHLTLNPTMKRGLQSKPADTALPQATCRRPYGAAPPTHERLQAYCRCHTDIRGAIAVTNGRIAWSFLRNYGVLGKSSKPPPPGLE